MKLSEKIAIKITEYVKKTLPDKNKDDLEIIKYGIEIVFMNLTKIPIILIIGYLLSIFKETIWTIFLFSFIRRFAAGIHARKSYTCLMSMLVVIFGTIYISLNFIINVQVKIGIFLITSFLYLRYAPADTEEKPYLNYESRKKLKKRSLIVACMYLILSLTIKNIFLSNMIIHILWVEGMLILPITYKVFKRRYNNYEYYKEQI